MNRRRVMAAFVGLFTQLHAHSSLAAGAAEEARALSLIRLIANPSSFDGRRVRLAGYLYYNGVDRAIGLYVSELDGRNSILSNSVDLHLEKGAAGELVGKYVILDGTFHAPTGPGSEYLNGFLSRVSDLKAWGPA
jgi:hypothetical protein